MNQSLDHDEIINVRWATDDPNPAAIKREKRRMEEEGGRKIVDSMSAEQWAVLDARRRLEEGNGQEGGDDEDQDGASKRLRLTEARADEDDEEMRKLIEENQRNWDEMNKQQQQQQQEATSTVEATAPAPAPEQSGIFSAEAMGGLAHLQQLRRAQEQTAKKPEAAPKKGLGGLAAYDSDSD